MPRQYLTVAIPQPCSESWATMTPAAQGRHCAACHKVVVDFTVLSDAEVVALLHRTAAPCGRFREDQLGRPLLAMAAPAPRWRTWLAAAAAVLGLRETLPAPAVAQRPSLLATPPLSSRQSCLVPLRIAEIQGRVSHAGRPLTEAQVQIAGTAASAYTTPDGHFLLTIPVEAAEAGNFVLTVSTPGYRPYQLAVMLDDMLAQPLEIEMEPLVPDQLVQMMMGGVSTRATIVERPIRVIDLENAVRMATSRNP
jgi:Carboxypeptidase regulatory-like domain